MTTTILFVDDDAAIREVTARLLSRLGHIPCTAASGKEALAFLDTIKVDLIILDLVMPGFDGHETLRRIRSAGVDTPVIFCSGLAGAETEDALFLAKPYSIEDLKDAIDTALGSQGR